MKKVKLIESFISEKKKSDMWSPYQKADILAGDMFGEMGLFSLRDEQLDQIIDLKKADKLAKKQFGEFGFKTLAAKEMEELLDANPKLLRNLEEDRHNNIHKNGLTSNSPGVVEAATPAISVQSERHFGKKGIIIMIDDHGDITSAIFKDKKNADKYNRNDKKRLTLKNSDNPFIWDDGEKIVQEINLSYHLTLQRLFNF